MLLYNDDSIAMRFCTNVIGLQTYEKNRRFYERNMPGRQLNLYQDTIENISSIR